MSPDEVDDWYELEQDREWDRQDRLLEAQHDADTLAHVARVSGAGKDGLEEVVSHED
ncbi:hypothetical protein [Humibacter sp.]|uniref:hypothetical protein n=1 Tax=Humibacter sp. TaxID=1940291 RepID=UPI003F819E11